MNGLSQELLHERNVRIGVVDVFTAPEGTPVEDETAWTWEGVIEAGSETYAFPTEMFELKTGHPNTTKVQAVIGREGTIGFTFEEYTARAVDLAAGGAPMTKEYATTTPPADTVAAAPAPTAAQFALTTGHAAVASGQRIEVETPNGLEDTYIEAYDAATATVTVKPALSAAPLTGNDVKWIKQYVKPIGGFDVPKRALKTVFTDRNLEEAVIYVPCVASTGNYQPNFADARSNAKVPVELRAYGKEVTLNGKKQPVVAYHYLKFPGVS